MSAGRPGALVFDPDQDAVSGAEGDEAGGGRGIGSAGPWYSRPTSTAAGGWSMISDQLCFDGTLEGSLHVEISNASDDEIRRGVAQWDEDDSIDIPAIAAGTGTGATPDTDPMRFVKAESGSDATVDVATTTSLPACTAAGSGIGKTLTGDADGALTIDGVAVEAADVVLVKDQVDPIDNGVYVVTDAGDESSPFVLTRHTDFDDEVNAPGVAVAVTDGEDNAGTSWIFAGAPQKFALAYIQFPFDRFRLRFDRMAGQGSIKSRRSIKAGG